MIERPQVSGVDDDPEVARRRAQQLAALKRLSGANDSALERLSSSFPRGRGLATATEGQLRNLGCSIAQARRIRAAFDLVRVAESGARKGSRRCMRCPEDAWRFILDHRPDMLDLEIEQFLVVALNARQRPIELFTVGQGSVAQVDVHPREVFVPLVRMRAHSCLVAHNHPSGEPDPSEADIQLTHRLVEGGRLLGIPVLDHLVLTSDGFTSLAQSGLVP